MKTAYHILVAEDSKPITRNIIRCIESLGPQCRCRVVDYAYNGEDALEKIKHQEVDILLTDIRMPVMDGLALIATAKKMKPNLKCIILSGYDDFKYAHQAMKLQIDEYLLKPINPDELQETLLRIAADLDAARASRVEKALSNLFMNLPPDSAESKLFQGRSFMIAVIRVGAAANGPRPLGRDILQPLISNLAKVDCWVIDSKYISETIIVYDAVRPNDNPAAMETALFRALCQQNETSITMISSFNVLDASKLQATYNELSTALNQRIILGKSQILSHPQSPRDVSVNGVNELSDNLEKKFAFLININQSQGLFAELTETIAEWEQKDYPVIVIRKFLKAILYGVYKACGNTVKNYYDSDLDVEQILATANSYAELQKNVLEHFRSLLHEMNEIKKGSPKDLFECIDVHLKSNLYGNLSMQDLSNHFRVTPSYITRIINANCHTSPMDYYMQLKITEAKKLLLANKDAFIKDIANSLGFNDQFYFSKVFKAHTGLSPVEFRKVHCETP